jgi:hypothetical protein
LDKCYFCDQKWKSVKSCVAEKVLIGEQEYPQIFYGEEIRFYEDGDAEAKQKYIAHTRAKPCSDCGVVAGSPHHPGCEVEECPKCNGRVISCGCLEED